MMINYNIKKITGDLGNFIKIDEHVWANEDGLLINLESTDFNDRDFKWTAAPETYYISISEICDTSAPTKELELCLIEQLKDCASKLWFVKYSDRPWEYQTLDIIVDIAGFKSNYKSYSRFSCYVEERLILTEITKEMFETIREQLRKTGKFEFETET